MAVAALVLMVALTLGACGGSSHGSASPATASATDSAERIATVAVAEAPCGAAAARTAARAAGDVAERIYQGELSSSAVHNDKQQVESYQPLLSALASGDRAGVREAVHRLVYSGTHVVRLRVSRGGELLADDGGPYIIAPVSGTLRYGGRTVGRYLLSVQDDLGYVKLETRFVGMPVLLRLEGQRVPIEGNLSVSGVPRSGPYRYHGRTTEVYSFVAKAYPRGALDISLLVPAPRASSAGCRAIEVAELQQISERIWHRFSLVSAPAHAYANNNKLLTGALTYVRSGSHQLAGNSSPGPSHLPDRGAVRYRGRTYDVRSFPSHVGSEAVRIYLMYAA